jgi:hypothetical protein
MRIPIAAVLIHIIDAFWHKIFTKLTFALIKWNLHIDPLASFLYTVIGAKISRLLFFG